MMRGMESSSKFICLFPGEQVTVEAVIPDHLFAFIRDVGAHGSVPFQGVASSLKIGNI
jgi:hypothetical protein